LSFLSLLGAYCGEHDYYKCPECGSIVISTEVSELLMCQSCDLIFDQEDAEKYFKEAK